MSLLNLDLVIATLLAFGLGLAMPGSWRRKTSLCLLVALLAWGVRVVAIVTGDATLAEDYLNGLNVWTGAVELAVALAWTGLWCALGTAAAQAIRRKKADVQ